MISRIAQGDKKALADLYDHTSEMVYSLVLRIVGEAAAAEEITLEVYMQVWRTASNFKPGSGSVDSWLTKLAGSRAIERFRSRREIV